MLRDERNLPLSTGSAEAVALFDRAVEHFLKILEQADRIAPRWSDDLPGYDCCQCIWAFAHEETDDYAGAERAVDAAWQRDHTNYFAHHVKAHILEMDCRPRESTSRQHSCRAEKRSAFRHLVRRNALPFSARHLPSAPH